jgi:hypothetical protein
MRLDPRPRTQRFSELNRYQLVYLWALALPTMVLVLLGRLAMLQIGAPDAGLGHQVVLSVADIATWGALILFAFAVLGGRHPRAWLVALVVCHCLWNFLELTSVGVLVSTTAYLDWPMLQILVEHPNIMVPMATVATPRYLQVLLVAVVVQPIVTTPVVAWLLRRRGGESSVNRPLLLVVAACAVVIALVFPVGVPDRHAGQSAPMGIAESMAQDVVRTVSGREGSALVGPARAVETGPARDVVVIFLESTSRRATTLGDPGLATTPHLAGLARTGADVENMSVVISHTSQATAAVMCGTWPEPVSENAAASSAGPSRVCLPRLLARRGYRTGWFQSGYTYFENDTEMFKNLGFDTVVGREDLGRTHGFATVNYFGLEDKAALAPSESWLRRIPKDQHVVLGYSTLATHHDYDIPHSWIGSWVSDKTRNRYLSAVHYSDSFVADVVAMLKRTGRWGNTDLLVIGDHGEAFGEHGLDFHTGVPYDEVMKVPAVFTGPGVPRGPVRTPASQVDVLPTLAKLAGFELEGTPYPGVDIFGPLGTSHRQQFFDCGYDRICTGVQDWPWKFIDNFDRKPAELYDLVHDPLEQENVAGQHPDVVKRLDASVQAWRREAERPYD